ncbi:MAG: hypothetical protein ACI85U_004099 [Candidatus Promineifilaceae bacterium]|jgi:hypothetical protein
MNSLRRHFYIHRPFLLITTLTLLAIMLCSAWFSFAQSDLRSMAAAILSTVLLLLFVLLQIWFYSQIEKTVFPQVARWMITKGRISSQDQILFPYACDSRLARPLISHLSTGKLWLIDLYTPQLMTAQTTSRTRSKDLLPSKDPRFKLRPGNITLLPFQNDEIDVVVIANILTEITQFGDRKRFLTEINRVLKPNGRILIFEPIKSMTRTLVNPSSFFRFWTSTELMHHLDISGFTRVEVQTPAALTLLGRGLIPGRHESVQLPLEF